MLKFSIRTTAVAFVLLSFLPLIGFALNPACDSGADTKFSSVLNRVACDAGLTTSWSSGAPITEETFIAILGGLVSIVLGFVGVVFAILTIYGGYLWMTARGNEEQVQHSQDYIRNSVIGLIIVLAAFSITQFVVTRLITIVSQATSAL